MAMHWKNSLSARLWLINVLALALSLGGLASVVIWAYDRNPESVISDSDRMETAHEVADKLRFDDHGQLLGVTLNDRRTWLFKVAPADLAYRVLDARGNVLLNSSPTQLPGPWLAGLPQQAAGTFQYTNIGGREYVVATVQVRSSGASKDSAAYFVRTATSVQFIEALASLKIKPVPRVVEVIVAIATLVFGLTLPLTIRQGLKPLREVSAAAARITPRNLKARLPTAGVPSEIGPLIDAFNAALSRLEEGFNAQQQFLASAAHELQTPLTLLRGQIELQPEIRDKELLCRDIDLMARHVRQLLHLAEVRESGNFSFAAVNALEVIGDVTDYLSRKADAKAVQFLVDDADTATTPAEHRAVDPAGPPAGSPLVRADRSALFILLKNLVENAISISPEHGIVTVRLDHGGLHVIDEGPGISTDDMPRLFTRFWRSPASGYDGTGLGLAICKEIALAHGWTLSVHCGAVGTRFTVNGIRRA